MVGSIKTYTPKYSFIIPEFDIATWHDYMESNFRAIDALLYNLYGINNFKGEWTKLTEYKVGDVLFVGEDKDITGKSSEYEGRLVKVIKDHVTDNSDGFHYFYELNPDCYELYFDANNAAYFAQKSKESADASEVSYQNSKNLENIYINFRDLTEEYKNLAQDAATNASNSEQSALTAASTAINTVQAATDLLNTTQQYTEAAIETITHTRDEAVETVTTIANEAKTTAENAITSVENTKTEAENEIAEIVEQGRVTIQTYVDNAEEEVREIARVEAQEAIADAKQDVQDYTDTTIKPSLQIYVDNAENRAQIATQQADIATIKANESLESANISTNSATSAQSSAETAEEWARYAEGKANPNWGYIGGDLENQTDLMDKFREIELFKFPNATIIGEPTIQNGQVSNFSTTNFLQFPFILDLHEKAFQIDMCFTTSTNVQTQQNILDSKFGLALAIQNGKGVMAISYNGVNWDIGSVTGSQTLQPNTTYYARLIWNRLQYKTQLSTDGINYVDDMVIVDTRRPYPTTIFIGGCDTVETGHTGHPFLGTINMNKCSLTVMGNVIWQGMDDVGLSTRADNSLSNLDAKGNKKFTDLQDDINKRALKTELPTIARANVPGLVAGGNWLTVNQSTGKIECGELSKVQYDNALGYTFISKTTLENVITPRLNNKQNTLVSGTNIKTIGGNSLLGSGDIEVGANIPSMTLADYEAMPEHDPEQYYAITDDVDTGTNILKMIYPVGSIYETSNPTCPLANLFGTWVQEPNIVNDKFIIETYIDGANGYRICNDGYCEQWGRSQMTSATITVTLTKTYKNTNYNITGNRSGSTGDNPPVATASAGNTFSVNISSAANTVYFFWKTSGYLASDQYIHINVPTYNKFRRIA